MEQNVMQNLAGGKGVMEQFMHVLSGVLPILDTMKQTLEESTGKIPKVSSQLNSVTQATESATVEILNVLDTMSTKLSTAGSSLLEMKTLQEKQREIVARLKSLPGFSPEAVAVVVELEGAALPDELFRCMEQALNETMESSMSIAMALQVQDITSQQLAGVTHMVESVREQLFHVLDQFSPPGEARQAQGDGGKTKPQNFDTDAQYTKLGERQDAADEIIDQWKKVGQ